MKCASKDFFILYADGFEHVIDRLAVALAELAEGCVVTDGVGL